MDDGGGNEYSTGNTLNNMGTHTQGLRQKRLLQVPPQKRPGILVLGRREYSAWEMEMERSAESVLGSNSVHV